LVGLVPLSAGDARKTVLSAVEQHANRETLRALAQMPGADASETRRVIRRKHASRLFLRTLGGVSLHRGGWQGPEVHVEKRRVRALLAVLAAHSHTTLTRDLAVDLLWPEADGDAAINNLNQTVFQLRRFLDPTYRQNESPEYIVSNAEQVALAADLVHTDVEEVRRLPDRLAGVPWPKRQEIASRAIALVRGEFLADLRYEPWAAQLQLGIHNEVRARLLPIARQSSAQFDIQVSMDAAAALIAIDPFDESATLALADALSRSGKRVSARNLLVSYADRLRRELDEGPSPQLSDAAVRLGSAKPDV
jgi:DNA-binding SARP family transcriptional activator